MKQAHHLHRLVGSLPGGGEAEYLLCASYDALGNEKFWERIVQKHIGELVQFLLAPVVRFFIRHSVNYQASSEILKQLYVLAAKKQLEREGSKINVSRISAATGIHRREVKTILSDSAEPNLRLQASVAARVLTVWENSTAFTNSDGTPKTLSYQGDDSEFHQVVKRVSSCLHPGTILFQLERLGAVKKTDDGLEFVKAEADNSADLAKAFRLLAADIDSLVHAVEENISKSEEEERASNLHMTTRFDKIDPEKLEYIRHWVHAEGQKFQEKVRKFLARYDEDLNPDIQRSGNQAAEVTVGAFSHAVVRVLQDEEGKEGSK